MSFTFRDSAPLAACMMVSKRVRALTKPHSQITSCSSPSGHVQLS